MEALKGAIRPLMDRTNRTSPKRDVRSVRNVRSVWLTGFSGQMSEMSGLSYSQKDGLIYRDDPCLPLFACDGAEGHAVASFSREAMVPRQVFSPVPIPSPDMTSG